MPVLSVSKLYHTRLFPWRQRHPRTTPSSRANQGGIESGDLPILKALIAAGERRSINLHVPGHKVGYMHAITTPLGFLDLTNLT